MTHLLDTDVCIGVLRQKPGMVLRMNELAPSDVAVSAVTVYELYCGVEKSQNPMRELTKVERFLSLVTEVPFQYCPAISRIVSTGYE